MNSATPMTPAGQHWMMELAEDAFLLLLIVFAVPALMLLLAVPIAVVLHLAVLTGVLDGPR